MVQGPQRYRNRWIDRLSRSGFFFGALLFHLIIFLGIAGWIVFSPPPAETPEPPIKFVSPPPQGQTTASAANNSHSPSDLPALINPVPVSSAQGLTTDNPHLDVTVQLPQATDTIDHGPQSPQIVAPVPKPSEGIPDARLNDIRKTVMDKWHLTQEQIANDDPSGTFPIYVAAYGDGDWACNTRLDQDGKIVAGSIPNLAAKIKEWSHGAINAQVVPKPLNIGSSELLDTMPPFIFFTGHKDFHLTDQEVENLAKYLERGGAIWGDNALAGTGSRFDVAFRREMKRVVPGQDFAPLTVSDDIFAKGDHPVTQIPRGMNYYGEAPEHIDIDGVLAILYTPNDYSDMMFMRVLPGDTDIYIKDNVPPNTLYTDQKFWYGRDVFFRNFDLDSAVAVNRMGMKVFTYLILRFNSYLLTP
ncbi:MAG: DUF4159 domain-containing protein [Methylacidiphilales bacterium]|nr:DUF4159 domain-containing protein [Candidatus Methylacidiphilales bacterium]